MQNALKLKTNILPGKRIAFTAPELPESGEVELIVVLPERTENTALPAARREFEDVIAFLDSLPEKRHTPEEWETIEREFREERDSWERELWEG